MLKEISLLLTLLSLTVFSLSCGFVSFTSTNKLTESEQEKLEDWCFKNGQIYVSCPLIAQQTAMLINDYGYEEDCLIEAVHFYLRTGIDTAESCK